MPNIVARIALHLALACVLLEARVQGAGEGSTPPSDTGTCADAASCAGEERTAALAGQVEPDRFTPRRRFGGQNEYRTQPANHFSRAQWLYKVGEREGARMHLRAVTEQQPELLDGWMELAEMEMDLLHPAEAMAALFHGLRLARGTADEALVLSELRRYVQVATQHMPVDELNIVKAAVPEAFAEDPLAALEVTWRDQQQMKQHQQELEHNQQQQGETSSVGGEEPTARRMVMTPSGPAPTAPPSGFPKGRLHQLWATPILHMNLVDEGLVDAALPVELATAAQAAFDRFRTQHYQPIERATLNDAFYLWQSKNLYQDSDFARVSAKMALGTGVEELYVRPEFAQLRQHVQAAFYRMADEANLALPERYHFMYAWTSVHLNRSQHMMHSHEDSVMAAVFYCQTPPGTGRLTFHDPRGRLAIEPLGDDLPFPPFFRPYWLEPRVGDLVIFPGWLLHGVEESATSAVPRVSISFNFRGQWAQSDEGGSLG